jgi:hypothetical protein
MKVRQHIPNFFSGFQQQEAEANTLEDLLAIEFVDRWTADPHFHRFSVEWNYGDCTDCHLLMAETHEGKKWWVVAYLSGPIDPIQHLPKWTGGKERL